MAGLRGQGLGMHEGQLPAGQHEQDCAVETLHLKTDVLGRESMPQGPLPPLVKYQQPFLLPKLMGQRELSPGLGSQCMQLCAR